MNSFRAFLKKHYSYMISLGLHSAVILFLLFTPTRHFGGDGWGPLMMLGAGNLEQNPQIASTIPEEEPTPKKEKTKKPKVTDGKDYVQPMKDEIAPTPTPEPTDKPSPTPKPTNTPKPTATEKPTKTPTPEVKPTDTKKPTPKPTKTPKPKTTPTEKPKEKATPTPTKAAKPTPLPTLAPLPPVAQTNPNIVPLDQITAETAAASPAAPDPSLTDPGNPMGVPGGAASGVTFLGDPGTDYSIYAGILNKILRNNWRPPTVKPAVMKQYTAIVAFTINPDGTVSDVRFNMNSGWPALDMTIQDAVNRSSPLTQLAGALSSGPVKVMVPFRFTPKQ